ncbi:hypothetical protein MSUIS_01540 [Mycoplasma suis KI3806]|uniref:Uncharacterized protein n=2 Tax=Mycoplasma suis TaxID=57372 RepID=F0V325_MYCS3|nr:hypothetical protein MSUIS_01540 [Mycoplasma suis KI3806]
MIDKGRTQGGYFCKGWVGNINEKAFEIEKSKCEEKIKNIWKQDLEEQPQLWFRSDRKTVLSFFESYLNLSRDKNHFLRWKEEGEWETNGRSCSHKKDINEEGKIVVGCE